MRRRSPVGAELTSKGVAFRVWAAKRTTVDVVIEAGPGETASPRFVALQPDADGWFAGEVSGCGAGTRYRFRLDGDAWFPDPASRAQPDGPHGASQVLDPSTFVWTDAKWPGLSRQGQVLYELHVGTFTQEGTWAAAAAQLPALADLGVTCVNMMPIAAFPGDFGWGYDGVNWCAPTPQYGTPDDLRRFVDTAHALGLGVILDVVYNHFGPDGNYVGQFTDAWFTDRYKNDWGTSLDFEQAPAVRAHALASAEVWVGEYHFDGLRLDATQDVKDATTPHILAAMTHQLRARFPQRKLWFIAENEPQDGQILRPAQAGGWGLDAAWNDDFHHSAMVVATGQTEAYYADYSGTPQEILSALRWSWLYQGQRYFWQDARRGGSALDLVPLQFVHFLQNHDQVANSARGLRLHQRTDPGLYRALTALLLLGPQTPMLFQGQEFAASAPFFYFAHHKPELAKQVARGRRKFLAQFPRVGRPAIQRQVPAPHARATFERCKLDHSERTTHRESYALHRDLLALRKSDAAFARQLRPEGAVLSPAALVLRFAREDGLDRLVLLNLGADLTLAIVPEPLLAPPLGQRWKVLWSSEDPRYGGDDTPVLDDDVTGWWLPARSLVVLEPQHAAGRPLARRTRRRGN